MKEKNNTRTTHIRIKRQEYILCTWQKKDRRSMTLNEFKKSLSQAEPPEFSPLLKALWFDGINQWDIAHQIVQDINGSQSCLIHAYLHRKEGDLFNAAYWYHRAGRKMSQFSLEQEWEERVCEFL